MDAVFEHAGWLVAGSYMVYLVLIAALGIYGIHAGVLGALVFSWWRRRRRILDRRSPAVPRALFPLELVYGFINPLIYLLVLTPYAVVRPRTAIDGWLDAVAWTLFVALWAARLLLPRTAEVSIAARMSLARLCALGIATVAAYALTDLTRAWWPLVSGRTSAAGIQPPYLWFLVAFGPLYVIPAWLLNDYRSRLTAAGATAGFLLLSRRVAYRLAVIVGGLVLFTLAASAYRRSDAATRARIEQLTPAIQESAARYGVDPALIAAIVYVTEREQFEPFRDALERFATTAFLMDEQSTFSLSRRFDLSIGVAQIKPVTALTALKVCKTIGQPWELWFKHLRDVPELGREWQLGSEAVAVCQPPVLPVPINKPEVVSALMRDDGNVAFAGLILGLYRSQWRSTIPSGTSAIAPTSSRRSIRSALRSPIRTPPLEAMPSALASRRYHANAGCRNVSQALDSHGLAAERGARRSLPGHQGPRPIHDHPRLSCRAQRETRLEANVHRWADGEPDLVSLPARHRRRRPARSEDGRAVGDVQIERLVAAERLPQAQLLIAGHRRPDGLEGIDIAALERGFVPDRAGAGSPRAPRRLTMPAILARTRSVA